MKIFLLSFIFILPIFLTAQNNTNSVIYLKNGSMIKGNLLEAIPDSIAKIETADGSIFVFDFKEIKEIKQSIASFENSMHFRNPYTIHKRISGYGLFTAWALTAIGSGAMGDNGFATTVIPVIGPFITMNRVESDPNKNYLPGGKDLLILSGTVQSAFALYYFYSIIASSKWEQTEHISILPKFEYPGIFIVYNF